MNKWNIMSHFTRNEYQISLSCFETSQKNMIKKHLSMHSPILIYNLSPKSKPSHKNSEVSIPRGPFCNEILVREAEILINHVIQPQRQYAF